MTVTDLTDQLPALSRFGTVSKYDAESYKKGIRNTVVPCLDELPRYGFHFSHSQQFL